MSSETRAELVMMKIDRCRRCGKLTYLPEDDLCLLCLKVVSELDNIEKEAED